MSKLSLAEANPELAKQWHPTKNGELTPGDVTPGSHKKVWWKCEEEEDHEWEASIKNRSNGNGCSCCRGLTVVHSNCLATLDPQLAGQWHPSKNDGLTPFDVTLSSNKNVWWKCDKAEDHEWEASPNKRVVNGCPCCSGYKVVNSNCLATLKPKIAEQWHPTKNGKLTPSDVTSGSNEKVWWKCNKADDHEWLTTINDRSSGKGCPICSGKKVVLSNCLATLKPDLAVEWHPIKNGDLTPFNFTLHSKKNVWWKCDKADDHEWKAKIGDRQKGNCPMCAGQKAVSSNCLQTTHPDLSEQWHPTKNGDLTPRDITHGSNKNVWWKCDKADDHVWKASPNKRSINGCPCCSGYKVVNSNCLATTHPKLAKEWHPTKNGDLTPRDIISGSNKKFWWKCNVADDHEWQATSNDRSVGTNCPCCDGKKTVLSNCLATTNPEIAKQWHPTKNGNSTPFDLTSKSGKRIWWKCDKEDDHEWVSQMATRSNHPKCPCCIGQKVVPSNCLATTNPKLAKEWHPTKNGDFTPNDTTVGSHKTAWWKCDKADDHEWKTAISNRKYNECPYCTLTPQSKQELIITFELKTIFKNIDPKGFKTILDGRLRAIDIFIPTLKLAIEFDGNYWHKDKIALDKIKSEMLLKVGFKLIRVRQEPLKKIYDTDIISKQPFNGKQVTNDLLSAILSMYDLGDKKVSKIKEYQLKDGLQNEKGLDRYIDKILTEKASKSSN